MEVRLVFCLPTCEPDMMLKFLAPSIHLLENIKDIVEFCICFQPPYTNEEVEKTLNYFEDFNVKWFYKDYNYKDGKIPLIKMRNDCAMLEPDTDYYALLDDDMQFKEGLSEFYLKAIRDFDENPSLGVVGFTSFKRGYDNYFGTDKGIIYRGGKFYGFEGLVPEKLMKNCKTLVPYENENLLELIGGQQDKFCAMIRLATGQFSKQYDRVPCLHQENRHYRGARQFGWLNIEYEPNSVTSFIRKYFRKDFYSKNSNVLFEDSLLYRIYTVMTLDGTRKVFTTEHSTVRNEKSIPIVSRKGKLSFTFRMLETGDFREFTVMQIHSLDTRPAKPIIRICIIGKIICITYKDSENINHYTKIDNFELNTDYTIVMEVNEDVISIQNGKWKYPNWAKEMNFRYGLYTQTENGNYKMLVKNVFKGD